MPIPNFDEAKKMVENSVELTTGKVTDLSGNILFTTDRISKNEKTKLGISS